MTQSCRIFIAVTVPDNTREVLLETVETLKSLGVSGVRWTSKDAIHLTLKFLGNVEKWRIKSILHRLDEVALCMAPFHLRLGHLHTFPPGKLVRILWAGIEGNLDALLFLQDSIEEEMVDLELPKDKRNSVPHITLGRVKNNGTSKQRKRIRDVVDRLKAAGKANWEVKWIDVMESQLFPSGAVYHKLGQIRLSFLLKKRN